MPHMVSAIRPREKEISPKMKKFMSIMLALALTIGVAGITVAQDTPPKKSSKIKGTKKKTDTSKAASTTTTKGKKGTGKKGTGTTSTTK
jgi:uncharacterized protein YxeA